MAPSAPPGSATGISSCIRFSYHIKVRANFKILGGDVTYGKMFDSYNIVVKVGGKEHA